LSVTGLAALGAALGAGALIAHKTLLVNSPNDPEDSDDSGQSA
jgi:hypothetical protein